MSAIVSSSEIKMARLFLQTLKAKATLNMIYAVVAWLRYAHPEQYLTPGADISRLSSGTRKVGPGYDLRTYLTFKNEQTAIQALATRILKAGVNASQYDLIVNAARAGHQFDFMNSVAFVWAHDAGMYGWSGNGQDIASNQVYQVYRTLRMAPTVTYTQPQVRKVPLPATQLMTITPLGYLDPYRIQGFYDARHKKWVEGVDNGVQQQ